MVNRAHVLVSWIAVNNDPFERAPKSGEFIRHEGELVEGPTLSLLFNPDSEFADKVTDVVLLHRVGDGSSDRRERRAVSETIDALQERAPALRIHPESWAGDDPTDHRAIFEFLRTKLPQIRRKFRDRELLLHISPGTPSMQTIWVLMAETGFIEPPFRMVKSYRGSERRGRPPVVPVEVGLETFYKAYRASHPREVASDAQTVAYDPGRFRTERMRRLFEEARRFAQVKVPVLILGERGTGKSTLAGWVRLHSPYRRKELDGQWPAVACGQYSGDTMRAELFGYKKGAFTGANSDKDGILATAHRDTLFLDEIGDVSRDLQRLLIKAVEEKAYFRLGDDEPRQSDFRLVSATNLDDSELRSRLDPDFLDRINALTLQLPPLREVPEELEWLWDSAFAAAADRSGISRGRVRFSDSHHEKIVAFLKQHPLPGNMRDLFRVAYRVIAARGDVFSPMSPSDSVDYGLQALSSRGDSVESSVSKSICRAFYKSEPIDGVIAAAGSISTRDLERELRAFLAREIRRIAKAGEGSPENLCDVTERTLRTWIGRDDAGSDLP
jgi:DNA-binding NtrC family response regulator